MQTTYDKSVPWRGNPGQIYRRKKSEPFDRPQKEDILRLNDQNSWTNEKRGFQRQLPEDSIKIFEDMLSTREQR